MKLIKLNCSACGAPISIPEDIDRLTCANCGTFLALERGEGYFALKAAEQISEAIHETGRGTQDAIRQGAQDTRKELQRLQLNQALGNANSALNATQAEQRALRRGQITPAAALQLQVLNYQQWSQWEKVRKLQKDLDILDSGPIEQNVIALKNQMKMLESSVQILRTCKNSPSIQQSILALTNENAQYQKNLNSIQYSELRQRIAAFTIEKPFSTDLNELMGNISQLKADVNYLNQQPPTTPVIALRNELLQLQAEIQNHYHQEIYRQCWGDLSRDSDPGRDPILIARHLRSTQATIQWLATIPNPAKTLEKEIKSLQRQEKKLLKLNQEMQSHLQIQNGAKLLLAGLAALAISAPFSQDLQEVRSQKKVYQSDLEKLSKQPNTPETQLAKKQLTDQYQEFNKHWASLEYGEISKGLKSTHIHPPFNPDLAEAIKDYDLVTQDVTLLKENQSIPGVQTLYKQALARQHELYNHLVQLKAQSEK